MASGITRRVFLKHAVASGSVLTLSLIGNSRAQAPASIVDAHAHLPLLKFGGPLAPRLARGGGLGRGQAALAGAVQAERFDEVARLRISDMDAWGVARTVVMPIDFGFGAELDMQWEEAEAIAEVCRKYSDRFVPFFACDPRRSDALDRLERGVRDLGMKGVKMHPLAGFAIDDEDVCFPYYKKCAELGVPVLGHCRPVGAGERDNLSRPERYGRVAKAFPGLRICLGHLGGGDWTPEALAVVERYPNAYGDVSTMQSMLPQRRAEFGGALRRAMDGPARNRVMYGSDWPTQRQRDRAFIDALQDGLPDENGGEPILNVEERALVLHKNAEAFLGR